MSVPKTVKPVVVSSANGNVYKNGGPRTAVAEAFERIAKGEDVLDALAAGVNVCELDPADDSVGYGGLPNADGVVQLDASCMHGPYKRAGAVACLEGVRRPSLVAKAVSSERFAGGIVAVANHVASLCDSVTMVTQLGRRSSHEDFVREHLKPGVRAVLEWREDAPTIVKRRFDAADR